MDILSLLVIATIIYCVAHYSYNTHKLNKQFADKKQ